MNGTAHCFSIKQICLVYLLLLLLWRIINYNDEKKNKPLTTLHFGRHKHSQKAENRQQNHNIPAYVHLGRVISSICN